jgi:ribosomal protein S27E
MRARIMIESSRGWKLRMRCPDCSHKYNIDLLNTGDINLSAQKGLRTFRPAFKRALQTLGDFYGKAIYEQRCIFCQSFLQAQLIENDASKINHSLLPSFRKLPRNFYLSIECPRCGSFFSDLAGLLIHEASFRAFLLDHARVVIEPSTIVAYAGQDAIRSGLLDLKTGEQMTMMVHPQTLHTLASF